MKTSLFTIVLLLALVATASAQKNSKKGIKAKSVNWDYPEMDGLVSLNDKDFKEVMDKYEYVLVEFCAVGCKMCEKSKKDMEASAKELNSRENPIMFARVDVDTASQTANQFKIDSTPTVLLFIKGKVHPYLGKLGQRPLVDWVNERARPYSYPLTTIEDITVFSAKADVVVMFFGEESSSQYKIYNEVAEKFYLTIVLGHCSDDAVRKQYAAKKNTVVIVKKFEGGDRLDLDDSFTVESLTKTIKENENPALLEINSKTKHLMTIPEKDSLILCIYGAKKDPYSAEEDLYRKEVFPKLKDEAHVSLFKAMFEGNSPLFKPLKLTNRKDVYPTARIIDSKSGETYKYPQGQNVTTEGLLKFWSDFKSGALKTHDQEEKEKKEEKITKMAETVVILTEYNWDKIVLDPKKDVLVKFYAPFCSHSKALRPIWEELAKEMSLSHDIVIAELDAMEFEGTGGFTITEYPTVMFFPSDDKSGKVYTHSKTLDNFIKYIHQEATVKVPVRRSHVKRDL